MPYRGDACHRHNRDMTDTPESHTEAELGAPRVVEPPRYRDNRYERPDRLNQILAWVGIVAGVVFIVAVIFFSGFFIGTNAYGNFRGGYHQPGMMGPSQTGPYGQMRPGMMGPYGQGPGQQPPTTSAPTTPRP